MPSLPTRPLGKNGPQVSALGFGAMGLSIAYGAAGSDEERLEFLDHLFSLGETFWDSADAYGDSEDLLGKWFAKTGKRSEIFLATKFGIDMSAGFALRSDREYIFKAVEKSLKRLGTDCIDLYYMHRTDGKTPIEETVKAMKELKDQGKIKYLGLSEVSAATLRRAYAIHPISAVQIEYSPFALEIEDPKIGLLAACRELGVAVIAYSPLGRGFLTGSIKSPDDFADDDFRKISPRFQGENFNKNLVLVNQIDALAKKKGCTAGQLTLAWLMAQGEDIIPIPGTKKTKYLEENLGALKVELTESEIEEIRKDVEAVEIVGGRYPEMMMSSLFADTPPL